MITRLLPDQISRLWPIIKYGVEQTLPPFVVEHSDNMNRILSSLLCGKTSCWISYRRGEETILDAVILTKIIFDDASYTKNLLLYSVYGYTEMDESSWIEGFAFMSKYAKSINCSRLIAYTDIPYLIEMAKKYDSEMKTFISFKI